MYIYCKIKSRIPWTISRLGKGDLSEKEFYQTMVCSKVSQFATTLAQARLPLDAVLEQRTTVDSPHKIRCPAPRHWCNSKLLIGQAREWQLIFVSPAQSQSRSAVVWSGVVLRASGVRVGAPPSAIKLRPPHPEKSEDLARLELLCRYLDYCDLPVTSLAASVVPPLASTPRVVNGPCHVSSTNGETSASVVIKSPCQHAPDPTVTLDKAAVNNFIIDSMLLKSQPSRQWLCQMLQQVQRRSQKFPMPPPLKVFYWMCPLAV